MSGINSLNVEKKEGQVIGASETDVEITNSIALSSMDSLNLRIDLVVSGVTVGGGITARLQEKVSKGTWQDLNSANSSVAITADGVATIRLNKETTADLVDIPVSRDVRVLVNTGAGSTVTIDTVVHVRKS